MIRVNVQISSVSGERFVEIAESLPPIQINTNLNLISMEKKDEETLEIPFVLSVNYNPSVAQLSLKGKAYVKGDRKEIDEVYSNYKERQPPPAFIVQSISNVAFVESVTVSRILNLPPPIPLPQIQPPRGKESKERPESSYTA